MLDLLKTFSWQELRHHPWRNAAAVVAVMLGVALAFAVHLINASALSEFSQAVRATGGEPDLSLRHPQGSLPETIFERVATATGVQAASAVLEISTQALTPQGARSALRVLGVDALVVARVAPALMPQPAADADRLALLSPGSVFLNAAARQRFGVGTLQLQSGAQLHTLTVAGEVAAGGTALAVMDIGAAQDLFGRQGQLSRIDLRLLPGTDAAALVEQLRATPGWPEAVSVSEPEEAEARMGAMSRAYRVNLTVLALVALFTGAFLVFSVLSLSVAKRAPQFALLAVLGLAERSRLALVLWESLALGLMGSAAGVALGTALAALALGMLGGDLGGGYFAGVAPSLRWDGVAALIYGLLGVVAALAGGWWPARQAQQLPPALTLKGLGGPMGASRSRRLSLAILALGLALAWAPPVQGLALGAYVSVALLLLGGIAALPWLTAWLLDRLGPWATQRLLPLLALQRARRQREAAAVAISGVVASLSLAVALTVMVASFRDSVTQWLDRVLPADLYVRSATQLGETDTLYFDPSLVREAASLPGVQRLESARLLALQLNPVRPAVALIARELADPARALPLVSGPLPVPADQVGIYVSEAMVDLHGLQPGQVSSDFSRYFKALTSTGTHPDASFFVAGVWRDYARQSGAVAMDRQVFERLTGDTRINDLALWLSDPNRADAVQAALRALAEKQTSGAGTLLDFGTSSQIRAVSLRIFDRSFAVTYWLQAVVIGIGLFGVAASFSAQVLARRKEFGLLAHLGLTRRQILTMVALEGLVATLMGALAGLLLGLAVAVVLVHVVNPQSFHWTMDLMLPWARLLLLCLAVVLAGTLTAWLAARPAAGRDAVLAVKEDW